MKRILIVKILGMFSICFAILSGIAMIGSVGAMEFGAPILRCTIQAIVFMGLTYGFGKLGAALFEI
jgi:hypothetical protein